MPFRWISAKSSPPEYITIDAFKRFYLSSATAKLLQITDWPARLFVGYDKANRRLVVGKAGILRVPNVEPFKFDSRRYSYAKSFIKDAGIAGSDLPLRFEYVGDDLSGVDVPRGARLFQLADHQAEDDAR